ncbi:MAG: hypothetical protein CMO01_08670 [Thalassobius sp.]|nr:hypothetical protein [Thalassovita sp.]
MVTLTEYFFSPLTQKQESKSVEIRSVNELHTFFDEFDWTEVHNMYSKPVEKIDTSHQRYIEVTNSVSSINLSIGSYDAGNFRLNCIEKDILIFDNNYSLEAIKTVLSNYFELSKEEFDQELPKVKSIPVGENQRKITESIDDTIAAAEKLQKELQDLNKKLESNDDSKFSFIFSVIIIAIIFILYLINTFVFQFY